MLGKGEDNLESGIEPDVFDTPDLEKNQGQSFHFSGDKEAYISLAEAARYTKFSQDYLSLMARTGRMPAKKFGRNWKARLRDVEDYIARMEAKAAVQTKTEPAPGQLVYQKLEHVAGLPLTNFARYRFQTVVASFLILTTVSLSFAPWYAPAQAAWAENLFWDALAKTAQGARAVVADAGTAVIQATRVAADTTFTTGLQVGVGVIANANQALASADRSPQAQLQKAGARALLHLERVGSALNNFSVALEARTTRRQQFILAGLNRSVEETVFAMDTLAPDLSLAVRNILAAPTRLVPEPVAVAFSQSIGATDTLIAAGVGKLETHKNELVRSSRGTVAGIREFQNEGEPFSQKIFLMVNDAAQTQKQLADAVQRKSNGFINTLAGKQRDLGTALLEITSGGLARAQSYLAQKINGGNARVAGVSESAKQTSGGLWQSMSDNLAKVSGGVDAAKDAWQIEQTKSKSSLASLWLRALDFILPDSFRQSVETKIVAVPAEAPAGIPATGTPQTIIITTTQQQVASPKLPAATPLPAFGRELALDKIIGSPEITGGLTVNGPAVFHDSLDLWGPLYSASGDVIIKDSVDISGGIRVRGLASIDELGVNGNAAISGTLTVSGHFITDSLGALYDLSVGRNLGVGGEFTVAKDAHIVEDLLVSKNLTVTQSGTINGSLTVAGESTLTGDTSVGGNLNVIGTITIAGGTSSGVFSITASSTSPALLVNQRGTGNILKLQDNGTDVLSVLDGGYVGIGTSSPASQFTLWSSLATSSNASIVTIADNASTTLLTVLNQGAVGIRDVSPDFGLEIAATSTSGYFAISSSANSDGNVFIVNNDGAVGIGTSSPSAALTLWGGTSGSGVSLLNVADSASTTLLTVLDNGNVGIGTTSPFQTLSVTGNVFVDGNISVTGPINYLGTATTTFGGPLASYTGDLIIGAASENDILLNPYGGNVGIGTTSPFTTLAITGNGYLSGTLTAVGLATFGNSSTTQATIGNMYLRSNTISATNDSGLALYDNASNGIVIADGGNVGIGDATPTYLLDVAGNGRFTSYVDASYFVATSTSATSTFAFDIASASGNFTVHSAGTTNNLLLNPYGGNVGIGTTSPFTTLAITGNGYLSGTLTAAGLTTLSNSSTTQATIGNMYLRSNTVSATNDSGLYLYDDGSNGIFVQDGGNVGIGDATPTYLLDVAGNGRFTSYVDASYFVATSTTASSTFNRISSGTGDLIIGAASENDILLNPYGGSVGIGTSSPTVTFSVNGNGYVTGGLGIGIATTTAGALQTSGDAHIGGDLTVIGNSTTLGGSSSDTLTINSYIKSNVIPNQNISYSLGSVDYYWDKLYVGELIVNNVSAASTTIGGTQSETFTINSDNDTADTQNASLLFFRGSVVPNAVIKWDATANLFDFNQPVFIQNDSTDGIITLNVQGSNGQSTDVLRIASSTGDVLLNVTNRDRVGIATTTPGHTLDVYGNFRVGTAGSYDHLLFIDTTNNKVGIGTSSPWAFLSVNAPGGQPAFAIGSSTTQFIVDADGNVGIGTTTPFTTLAITGNGYLSGTLTAAGLATLTNSTSTQATIGNIYLSSNTISATNDSGLALYDNASNGIVIADGGNVGIGDATPTYLLDVAGNGRFTSYVDASYFVATSTTASSTFNRISSGTGDLIIGAASENDILLNPYGGSVGIASTSPNWILSVNDAGNGFAVNGSGNIVQGGYQGTAIADAYISSATTWNNKWDLASSTIGVPYGGTGAISLSDGFVLLGNGTGAMQALDVTTDGAIVIGDGTTDPTTLAAFTGSTGTLKHEYGGIEADISAITTGGILRGSGAGAMAILALGTPGQILGVTGGQLGYITTSTMPFISTALTKGYFLVGDDTGLSQATSTIFISSTGNVGIGTTSPNHKLDINGNLGLKEGQYINFGYTDGTNGYGIYDNNGTLQFKNSSGAWANFGSGSGAGSNYGAVGALAFYAAAGTTATGTDPTLIKWDSSMGALGLGVTSPTYILDIASSTANNLFRVGTSTSNTMFAVNSTQIQANVPLNLNTTGNVQMASDLEFTDNTSASILSNAPMYITAGDASQNVSLYLKGSGYGGQVVVDDKLRIASTTNIRSDQSTYVFAVDWDDDGDATYAYVNNSNAWTAGSADYAEYFWTEDTDLESGEAVCVDVTKNNAVKKCARGADGNLMGIISTSPAVLGNAPGNEHRENNPNYKIVGMLGQVPAKVSTENGSIRPGDSLTSSALYPGYVMKAGAGDSTVGVALEALSPDPSPAEAGEGSSTSTAESMSATAPSPTSTPPSLPPLIRGGTGRGEGAVKGTINVLISRRNKSLTVEEVEQKVVERIAAMEIEDEVAIMVKQAVDKYNFDPVVSKIIGGELATMSGTFDSKLTVQKDELTSLINNKETTISQALGMIASKVDLQGVTISQLQTAVERTEKEILDIRILDIAQREQINIINNSTSTALTVAQTGEGNIAEFKNGTTTVLAIGCALSPNPSPAPAVAGEGSYGCKVKLANDVALAFGNDEPIKFAYNSQNDRLEILGTDKDLYVGLGTGRMIIGGAVETADVETQNFASLQVRGAAEITNNASSSAVALTVTQNGTGDIIEFKNATLAVMTIKNGGEVQVASGKQTICVGACPATETFTPTSEGDLGVEASVYAQDYRVHCPEGWVEVPRDNKHTFQNFCVQKHEATQGGFRNLLEVSETSADMPLINVTLAEAKNYCRSLGEGMHLVTDAEWMTMAEAVVGLPINDVSGDDGMQLGNGVTTSPLPIPPLIRGGSEGGVDPNINDCNLYKNLADAENAFSETCQISGTNGNTSDFGYTGTNGNFAMSYDANAVGRASLRTAVLPNGQIIWDIAGNASEWVDEIANADELPTDATPASELLEYPDVIKYGDMSYARPSGYNWTSANGIGQIYTDYSAGSALRGFVRGGSYLDGEKAGVFGLDLSKAPNYKGEEVGFRCAR